MFFKAERLIRNLSKSELRTTPEAKDLIESLLILTAPKDWMSYSMAHPMRPTSSFP